SSFRDEVRAGGEILVPLPDMSLFLRPVVGRREPQDFAVDGIGQKPGVLPGHRAEDFAQFGSPVAAHHNRLAPRMVLAGEAREIAEEAHPTVAYDVSLGHPAYSVGRSLADRAAQGATRDGRPSCARSTTFDYSLRQGFGEEHPARRNAISVPA